MEQGVGKRHEQSSTWNLISKTLLEDEDFGLALNRENNWMSGELAAIIQQDGLQKKKQKTFTVISGTISKRLVRKVMANGDIYTHHSLKDVFKKQTGKCG